MGEDSSSSDWLPKGWKVETRVRRNGKIDKCYTDPSNEHKFYSKPEVIRYLKTVGIKREEPTRRSSRNRPATKLVVKEAVAEGLPAGWIKEIRVTKKGNKIRRDPYYIDPVSGHLFRSMKEVFRYLDTGKMAKRSPKPKDQKPVKSTAETGKERSANNKAQKPDTENPTQKAAEEPPASNHAKQSKFNNLGQRENKEEPSESRSPVVEDLQEKLQPDTGGEGHGTECKKKNKLNKRRGAEFPRRTSKRLAGIAIQLPLEPKVRNRGHQATETHMGEGEAKCPEKDHDSKSSDEHVKRVATVHDANKKQDDLDVLSPGDACFLAEHAKERVVECNGDEKQETPLDLSLKDLLKDPCIEFAIKTLTGTIPILDDDKVAEEPVFSVDLPGAVPGNPRLPLGDIWADPCIEFAVKTLTGDVPVVNNRDFQNEFQQPVHLSNSAAGDKGLLLSNFWSTERNTASVAFAHSDKPFHKQL